LRRIQAIPSISLTVDPELALERQKRLDSGFDPDRVVGQWYKETWPDGTHVRAHYRGGLAPGQKVASLELGDEYTYEANHWIWLVAPGTSLPQWVDP
jgi:hypothetical protein